MVDLNKLARVPFLAAQASRNNFRLAVDVGTEFQGLAHVNARIIPATVTQVES